MKQKGGEIEISEWEKLKEKTVDLQNIVAKFRLKTLVVTCNEFKQIRKKGIWRVPVVLMGAWPLIQRM